MLGENIFSVLQTILVFWSIKKNGAVLPKQ
jgi:hypothetical protein